MHTRYVYLIPDSKSIRTIVHYSVCLSTVTQTRLLSRYQWNVLQFECLNLGDSEYSAVQILVVWTHLDKLSIKLTDYVTEGGIRKISTFSTFYHKAKLPFISLFWPKKVNRKKVGSMSVRAPNSSQNLLWILKF